MSPVSRLPSPDCIHFKYGRCLYTITHDPDQDPCLQCSLLQAWEREYDAVLCRAEAFSLSDEAAMTLLNTCMQHCEDRVDCSQRQPEADSICSHLLDSFCLMRLPLCTGACAEYASSAPRTRWRQHHKTFLIQKLDKEGLEE